jgi:hypothetical protein
MSRSLVFFLVFGSFLLFPGCRPPAGEGGSNLSSTDALGRTPVDLVEAWVGMWNGYDLDQVGELFLTDDRLTYFSSEFEGVIRGYDAVVEHHREFGFVPGGEERGTRLWVEALQADRFGGTAILTAIWYFQRGESEATDGSGGIGEGESGSGETAPLPASPPQRGPVTFVCILDEGRWRFAHMNFGNYVD